MAWGSGEQGREGRHAWVPPLTSSPMPGTLRLQCKSTAGDFGKGWGAELGAPQGSSRGGLVFGRFLLGVPLLPWSGGGKVPMPLSRVRVKEPQAKGKWRGCEAQVPQPPCLSLASCPSPGPPLDTLLAPQALSCSCLPCPTPLVLGKRTGQVP